MPDIGTLWSANTWDADAWATDTWAAASGPDIPKPELMTATLIQTDSLTAVVNKSQAIDSTAYQQFNESVER